MNRNYSERQKIVIIGNGAAGNAACSAIRLRSQEAQITLISDEPEPFYSPCIFAAYISKEIDRERIYLKKLGDYEQEGVHTLLGQRVDQIDPPRKRIHYSGGEISYDKLILALGSQPIVPAIPGMPKENIRVLKRLNDADYLLRVQGKKMAVIGSGPIGVELAVAFRKRNWEVHLIEICEWIMPNLFDQTGALLIQALLENQGIRILTSEEVLAIEGRNSAEKIITRHHGGIDVDLVVLGTGMQPSTELARNAGFKIGTLGGVLTNDRMETDVKDVFACGDCVEMADPVSRETRLNLLWPHAERQGKIAGYNCLGGERKYPAMSSAVNLDIFGKCVGAIGQPARVLGGHRVEVWEKRRKGDYHCLVVADGQLAGAQVIGDPEGVGLLFSEMGQNYKAIQQKVNNREGKSQFYWHYPALRFFQ